MMSMYRADGPAPMRPVGETEFVGGVAAMSRSGRYGPTRVAAGIVSFADLTLGEGVGPVLDAHIAASPRFRGIRHAAGWDASDQVRNSHTNPPQGLYVTGLSRGFAELARRGLSFDAWLYHPQLPELTSWRAHSRHDDRPRSLRGPLGIGPYENRRKGVFTYCGARSASWRVAPTWSPTRRSRDAPQWLRLSPRRAPATSAELVDATA